MGDGSSHHGRRSYLLDLFHPNWGKEPKLIPSSLFGPTIYQTFIMKLLDMEASTPYIENLPKEDRLDWKRDQSLRSMWGLVLTSINQHEEKTGQ